MIFFHAIDQQIDRGRVSYFTAEERGGERQRHEQPENVSDGGVINHLFVNLTDLWVN